MQMFSIMKYVKIISAAVCCASASAWAQTHKSATMFDEFSGFWNSSPTTEAHYAYTGGGDVSGGMRGSFSSHEAGATVKFAGVSKNKRHAASVYATYSRLEADFGGATAPFGSLDTLKSAAFYLYNINERWGVFANGLVCFSAENAQNWCDGAGGYAGAGAAYAFTPKLRVGFGAAAYSRLQQDWLGFPVAFVEWKITEQLTLKTLSGATLMFDVFKDNTLVLNAEIEYRNSYARLKNKAALRDSYWQFTLGTMWSPLPNFYAAANVGFNFAREMEFRNSPLPDTDISTAPIIMLNAGFAW